MNRKKSLSQLIRRVYRSKPSLKTTTMNLIRASLPIVCLLGSSEVLADYARITVNNNPDWNDSATGEKIIARGGHILDNRFNPQAKPTISSPDYRKFYMYGYDDNNGTNCYSSSDLANWALDAPGLPSAGSRPSVYLGKKTSGGTQYILTGKGGQVYTSSTPCGFNESGHDRSVNNIRPADYTDANGPSGNDGNLRWLGVAALNGGILHNELLRDSSVFQDDGYPNQTYLVARTRRYCHSVSPDQWIPYSSSCFSDHPNDYDGHGQYTMNIYKMNESGLQADTLLYREVFNDGDGKEAPSLFTRGSGSSKRYYMTASDTSGWKASKTWYKKSDPGTSFADLQNKPWIELSSDNNANFSYITQHDFVMKISKNLGSLEEPDRGVAGNYIFVGDRLADKCANDASCRGFFTNNRYLISTNPANSIYKTELGKSYDPNSNYDSGSLYHWMPVTFGSDGTPIMGGGVTNSGLNNWCIDVTAGTFLTGC